MKKIISTLFMMAALQVSATDYYVSTTGSDSNNGKSREAAFATLGAAQKVVTAGDNVYILPGTYQITEDQISREEASGPYKVVFYFTQQGQKGEPISFIGLTEDGNRPVFDMSAVNPAGYRVTAFLISGQYLVFRNFEVVGMMVNITTHTQSENFRISNASYNTFDNIACHDGMGIGFYLTNNSHLNLSPEETRSRRPSPRHSLSARRSRQRSSSPRRHSHATRIPNRRHGPATASGWPRTT